MSYDLAEVYVMKKYHNKKMQSATNKGQYNQDIKDHQQTLKKKKNISDGACFSMMFKKIYPHGNASS